MTDQLFTPERTVDARLVGQLPDQQRIHFAKEGDRSRRAILSELSRYPLEVIVVTSPLRDQGSARHETLTALMHALGGASSHVVIERDESLRIQDNQTLRASLRDTATKLSFEIVEPRHDPGLWAADAVAWAVQRGGDWTRRVSMHPIELLPCDGL